MKQRVKQPWYLHICSSVAVNGTTALECLSMPPSEISTVFGSDAVDCPARPPSETLLLPSFCKSIWHEKLYELPFPFLSQNLYTEATIKTPKNNEPVGNLTRNTLPSPSYDDIKTSTTCIWPFDAQFHFYISHPWKNNQLKHYLNSIWMRSLACCYTSIPLIHSWKPWPWVLEIFIAVHKT